MLEIRTLFVSTLLVDTVLAIVLFITWVQHREQFAGVGMWVMSLIMPTLTLVLVAMRGVIPDFISIVLALAFLPVGCMFMVAGLERFFGLERQIWFHVLLTSLYIPVIVYFTYFSPSIHMRVVAFNLVTAIQYFVGVHLLQYRVNEQFRGIGKLTAIILILMAFCNFWRIYLAAKWDLHPPPMATHAWDAVPLLFTEVLTIVLVVSWLMMVSQRHSSELARARMEMERSERRYKALVEYSPTGIAIIDQNEFILYANSQFSRLLKLNPEEVIGKDFKEFLAQEGRERSVNIFRDRQAGAHGVPVSHEVAIVGPSGRVKYIEVHGAILEKTSEYCHTLVQAVDVTARKKSEIALMDYQQNLESMLRGRTSSVIHGSDAGA